MNPRPESLSLALERHRRRAWVAAIADAAVAAAIGMTTGVAGLLALGNLPVSLAIIPALGAAWLAWRRPPSLAAAASQLDQQFDLHDLLASAWGVRDRLDQPWAASLWSLANTQAAVLPPAPWAGRFSPRQHACGLALAAAIMLATQLTGPAIKNSAVSQPLASTASPLATPVLTIADVHQRQRDTASSETRSVDKTSAELPSATGQSGQPAVSPAADAAGVGRADAQKHSEVATAASSTSIDSMTMGLGASGKASNAGASTNTPVRGTVNAVTGRPQQPSLAIANQRDTANRKTTAVQTPMAYHDLVRDFFAR